VDCKFEEKLNFLLSLSKNWKTDALFLAEAQSLAAELATIQDKIEPAELFERIGGLSGVLAAQERWLQNQKAEAARQAT